MHQALNKHWHPGGCCSTPVVLCSRENDLDQLPQVKKSLDGWSWA